MFAQSGCKYIEVRIFEFVAKTFAKQVLTVFIRRNEIEQSPGKLVYLISPVTHWIFHNIFQDLSKSIKNRTRNSSSL